MKRTVIGIIAAVLVGAVAATGIAVAHPGHDHTAGYAQRTQAHTVAKDQTVDGAFYGAGDLIVINGRVNGDVYCAGQSVLIDGTVNGDVFCAGQTIRVTGTVTGDVRLAGENITVDGKVAGTLSTFGQTIVVGKSAIVGRDFNGASQITTLDGTVGRDMAVASQRAIVNGTVGRNFNGYYENVTVTSGATIAGDAIFEGRNATIAEGSVAGETKRTTAMLDAKQQAGGFEVMSRFVQFLMLFVLALVLALLVPGHVRRATDVTPRRFWLSLLLGLGVVIGAPIVAILVGLTIVGLPLTALLLIGWAGLLLVSLPVASYYVGRQLLRANATHTVAVMAVGALVVLLAINIPYIGGLVGFVGTIAGVGMVSFALGRRWVKPSYKVAAPATAPKK